MAFESWAEKQIADAMARGEFDGLPGAGRPLPGAGEPDDENWWVRGYLRRERATGDALLPPELRLRKEVERLGDAVRRLRTEEQVRAVVAQLNARVRESWRGPAGPLRPVGLVDADAVVARWRADRPAPG
jgi:hypothetical protein